MATVLIAFASTYGQTKKVADRVAGWLAVMGHSAEVVDLIHGPVPANIAHFSAVILAGSLHKARHQPELEAFAKLHAGVLGKRPTLLISVSLSAAGKEPRRLADAERCILDFAERVGWTPGMAIPAAGALNYTNYNFLLRYMMRKISAQEGGDTDVTRDYEYTDWAALESFVELFVLKFLEPIDSDHCVK